MIKRDMAKMEKNTSNMHNNSKNYNCIYLHAT